MKKILLSAAFAVPFLMNAQTTLVSEDFDGYVAGDLLTDVGAANGWREWGSPNGAATAGYSAQVTDLAASSGDLVGHLRHPYPHYQFQCNHRRFPQERTSS